MQYELTKLNGGRIAMMKEATGDDTAAALTYRRKGTAARQFAVAVMFHDAYLMGLEIDPVPRPQWY